MNVPLELTGLTKVFPTPTGPFIAVKDVNASIEAGEFVAILGHSGCGKSTVLSILAGLDQATLICTAQDGGVPVPVSNPALAPRRCLDAAPGAPPPAIE